MTVKKTDNRIVLIGGGGHCKSCIDVIEAMGKYSIAGIIDIREKVGQKVLGYGIVGTDDEIADYVRKYKNVLITLGQIYTSEKRIKLFKIAEEHNACFPVVISPLAYVSKHAKIGKGTIVMHHALINADASIGVNCIINTKSLVEHDAVIGDHCHISTGAIVNGGVNIGNNTFYGSGAVSKEYISIPQNSFIKANSIVKSNDK